MSTRDADAAFREMKQIRKSQVYRFLISSKFLAVKEQPSKQKYEARVAAVCVSKVDLHPLQAISDTNT